jgi:soluble lytic murein transglycosylase
MSPRTDHRCPPFAAALVLLAAALIPTAGRAAPGDEWVVEAREAWRKTDRPRLARLSQQLTQAGHALAPWADYWELSGRLPQVGIEEVERFYGRWSGSYVEDRLRNDWLLELGRRRDAAAFARDLPRFRMNDDREVRCYALLFEAESGRDVRAAALEAWHAQRDADEGCHALATHLRNSEKIPSTELWFRLRTATEQGRPRAARAAAQLIGPEIVKAVDSLWDNPARFLARPTGGDRVQLGVLQVLAVMRMASNDPAVAARQLESPWAQALKPPWTAAAWGAVARQATLRQMDEAAGWAETALRLHGRSPSPHGLGDEVLGWMVRAQLRRVSIDPSAWAQVAVAIGAMSPAEQAEPAWTYWLARALRARARAGSAGEASMEEARVLLQRAASPLHFYGQLALEALDQPQELPSTPTGVTEAERAAAASHPGLQRALHLMAIGLRGEGVREWNFSLIGWDDRRLLSAAQLACDQQIWDRCINSSERSKDLINLQQRFPLPWREDITAAAAQAGLSPALVFGLIRQESRFITQARSHVGASGLMQVMPATARWTARRLGLEWKPEWRDDRAINLRLGTSYLRMVLDDFGGSLPMALAGYNAGPNRPRRWREGTTLEPAIWAETIPIHETRDYVKKVLANASLYAQRLGDVPTPPLKALLGRAIGPRDPDAPEPNKELP